MKEITKNTLKKQIGKLGDSVSLDTLESFIASGDIDGAIGELQKLKKMRKKLKQDD